MGLTKSDAVCSACYVVVLGFLCMTIRRINDQAADIDRRARDLRDREEELVRERNLLRKDCAYCGLQYYCGDKKHHMRQECLHPEQYTQYLIRRGYAMGRKLKERDANAYEQAIAADD